MSQAGFATPQRITLSEVAEHRKKDDAWSVFHGKVYNITPYMDFHPGGASQLMKCAGRDGEQAQCIESSGANTPSQAQSCSVRPLICPTSELKLTCNVVKTHTWVNAELMMDACMIGLLVKEPRTM